MKKLLYIILALVLITTCLFAGCDNTVRPEGDYVPAVIDMTKTEKEFETYLLKPSTLPFSFVYGDKYYKGIDSRFFVQTEKNVEERDGKKTCTLTCVTDDGLQVKLVASLYKKYSAYDYTLYFTNTSETNSKVLSNVKALDAKYACDGARIKGLWGDHAAQYLPYDFDLAEEPVLFETVNGRSCHEVMPYFNLEAKGNGSIIALGWSGNWKAGFTYDSSSKSVEVEATGNQSLSSYLKPNETVRTALVGIVRYFDADEDKALNMWRKWYIDCNMPYEDNSKTQKVQPHNAVAISGDTGRPNSDGSISEGHDTWYNSMSTIFEKGLQPHFRWLDAGWYSDPYKNSVASDWWGTVGTWDLDKQKWPDDTLKQCTDYCLEHGTKTFMWFEPERVTHLDGMVKNYGYSREWVLSDHGNNNVYINNLGNKDCLVWTLNRIIKVMEENDIYMYREDFNIDPTIFWTIGDGYEGENRSGITENLYIQGHYDLWDGIIEYCAQNGKCTYVDSCASGGGRNDLESMRRSVPFLRSDSDRTTVNLRLAYSTSLSRWLPYTGASANESATQLTVGGIDTYIMRATMLPFFYYYSAFYHAKDTLNWDCLLQMQDEWNTYKDYFYYDYYVLTPYRGVNDGSSWTSYMFFDEETQKGVVSAFRQDGCKEGTYTIQLKGVDPNKYYSVTDIDGVNSKQKVKGSALLQGLPLRADKPRTAIILYVNEVK